MRSIFRRCLRYVLYEYGQSRTDACKEHDNAHSFRYMHQVSRYRYTPTTLGSERTISNIDPRKRQTRGYDTEKHNCDPGHQE